MSSQNAYPKHKVLQACKIVRNVVEVENENIKKHLIAPKKSMLHGLITFSDEEAWARVSKYEQLLYEKNCRKIVEEVEDIIFACDNSIGDVVYLDHKQVRLIRNEYQE
jgi:hypothetical protein